jgi:hypothetical protein
VLDDVHRDDAAERTVRERRKALRHSRQRHVETALTQVRDGALIRIHTAGVDGGVATREEKLAATATDVEDRLMLAGALDVRRHVRPHLGLAAAQRVLETAIDHVGRRGDGGIHGVADTDGHSLDLLVERGDQRVVAFRGDRDELAETAALRGQGGAEIALDRVDIRAQVAAHGLDVLAHVLDQVQQDDVEVLLALRIGLAGATHETPEPLQRPLLARLARAVPAVVAPHLAPAIRTGGRSVDVAFVSHRRV